MSAWRISGPLTHGFGVRLWSWTLLVIFDKDAEDDPY